jgi:transposase
MEVVCARCAGIDVHLKFVTVCRIVPGPAGTPVRETRTVSTMTDDLLALGDWLAAGGVTHVVLESTGVYWKPLWNLFEEQFTLVLANAQHVKAVPGRKSDVSDAQWLAELLRHGLVQGSYVPDRAQRDLRELTRYRSALVRERSAEINRLQKTLEGANIKLGAVVSDITGVSARQMLDALVRGTTDGATLAALARGQLKKKAAQLAKALTGRMGPHQCFMVTQHLLQIDSWDERIAALSEEIAKRLAPFEALIARLDTIPGIGRWSAEVILAEIGTDMSRFPSAAHLASWAGMCPGQDESGGKRRSGRTRKGSPALRVTLTEAAYAASRTKTSVFAETYRRLAIRRGRKKATVAVGRMLLETSYWLLTRNVDYDDAVARQPRERTQPSETERLVRRLQRLGHQVTLTPAT